LAITESYYDCSTYVPGAGMTFDIRVKNNGEITANGLLAQIKGADGTVLSESLYVESLLPGATAEITCGFTPISVEPQTELTISVIPFNKAERNDADNQQP
jgi:archaellum component FlaF (FlaF/FlaG flagellin family)